MEDQSSENPALPRIGIWGLFDQSDLESQLVARVALFQLERHLPGVEVILYSPSGWEHAEPAAAALALRSLGFLSGERLEDLKNEIDVVWVVPPPHPSLADVLHAGRNLEVAESSPDPLFLVEGPRGVIPTIWGPGHLTEAEAFDVPIEHLAQHELVAVCDSESADFLAAHGVGSPVVAAELLLTVDAVFPLDLLDRRAEFLRIMDWLPKQGPFLAIEVPPIGTDLDDLVHGVKALIDERDFESIVLFASLPDTRCMEQAEALSSRLSRVRVPRAFQVGMEAAPEDLLAVIALSEMLICSTTTSSTVKLAYGGELVSWEGAVNPSLMLVDASSHDEGLGSSVRIHRKVTVSRTSIAERRQAATELFERIAALIRELSAVEAPRGSVAPWDSTRREGDDALRRAHRALLERLVRERVVFADRVRALQNAVTQEAQEARTLEQRLAELQASSQHAVKDAESAQKVAEVELDDLRVTLGRALEQATTRGEDLAEQVRNLDAELASEAARREAAERELERLRETKTFRYTRMFRRLYGRVRGEGR